MYEKSNYRDNIFAKRKIKRFFQQQQKKTMKKSNEYCIGMTAPE